MTRVAIIGTGDLSYGLAHLFRNNNCFSSSNQLAVTKPSVSKTGSFFHDTGVPVVSFEDAITSADVVILAIPAESIKMLVLQYIDKLKDKILVDATNSPVRGEDLHSVLAVTDMRYVKAFNDIGAVEVLLDKPFGKTKIPAKMCSRCPEAVQVVKRFAELSLGMDVKIVPFARYFDIAEHQDSLGEEWMSATRLMLYLFVFTEFYAVLRYNVYKGYDWFHLPLQVTNKAICWTSLNGFALSQVPGVLARLMNTARRDSLHTKPQWLLRALRTRKHLGLLSLWFLFMHVLMSMILLSPKYYGKFFLDAASGNSKLNSIGENSLFFGTLGVGLYVILGLCSMPSIGIHLTSKQWQLVYGPLAWIALAFGTVHVLIMGVQGWSNDQHAWPGNLPPITLMYTLIPLLVMGIKAFQIIMAHYGYRKQNLCPDPSIPGLVDESSGHTSADRRDSSHTDSNGPEDKITLFDRALISIEEEKEEEESQSYTSASVSTSGNGLPAV